MYSTVHRPTPGCRKSDEMLQRCTYHPWYLKKKKPKINVYVWRYIGLLQSAERAARAAAGESRPRRIRSSWTTTPWLVGCLICHLSGVLLSRFLTWNISILLDCHLVWLSCSRPLDNHALVVCLIFYCLVFYCLPFQLHIVVILPTQHFCAA